MENKATAQDPLPRYRSIKIVGAFRISHIENRPSGGAFLHGDVLERPFWVDPSWVLRHIPHVGGYLVRYEEGYLSFSPGREFEAGYVPLLPVTAEEDENNPDAFRQSFDARDWARAFMKAFEHTDGPDEATMVGWFANALMRGYDEVTERRETVAAGASK